MGIQYAICENCGEKAIDKTTGICGECGWGRDPESDFYVDLQSLLNRYSKENGSDTPDTILATYLRDCLKAYDRAVSDREAFYGRKIPNTPTVIEIKE